ncbi:hypothetical protein CYMTET_32465 [Cymbomonas tetramitiformis]|uniref:Uncharacterized protein n=1 Tax=Cymbomonas tetramitiformis TaxID=36881 RepID=A0AAE0FEZ6_9CHLO|nr:hypothetical protein CYMTET_32465 [Cymbomonas tetramitiformis]
MCRGGWRGGTAAEVSVGNPQGKSKKERLKLENFLAAKAEWTGGLDFKREAKVQRPAETKFTARSGRLKRLNSAPEPGQPARVGMPKAGNSSRH